MKIPLEVLTVVTGVSGSGKSTLIKEILNPALAKMIGQGSSEATGKFEKLDGDYKKVKSIEICGSESDWKIFTLQPSDIPESL